MCDKVDAEMKPHVFIFDLSHLFHREGEGVREEAFCIRFKVRGLIGPCLDRIVVAINLVTLAQLAGTLPRMESRVLFFLAVAPTVAKAFRTRFTVQGLKGPFLGSSIIIIIIIIMGT